MSITQESELVGMQKASESVALTLKEMRKFARPGLTTKELDDYGGQILNDLGAKSAPFMTYGFPGCGVRISDVGFLIETEAKKRGYKVIKNLTGHGIGRSLHEEPSEIANFKDKYNHSRFKKNSVVAIETFISTTSTYAETLKDGWTMVGNKGGFMAQHEHTIVVTDGKPIILTKINDIWD